MSVVHFPTDPDKFCFDASVATVFDDMAVRSIPFYLEFWAQIYRILRAHPQPAYNEVWDFGTTTGQGLLTARLALDDPYLRYYGVDISEPMLLKAKTKVECGQFFYHDLERGLPERFTPGKVSVAMFCWTLQFMQSHKARRELIQEAYDGLSPGGILIIAEKFEMEQPMMQHVQQEEYLWWRRGNGYTIDEIEAKNRALQNAMWPWKISDLERALGDAKPIWLYRMFNFGAVMVVKPYEGLLDDF